jgi:transcriptional regulator with XRE-family HTH domain
MPNSRSLGEALRQARMERGESLRVAGDQLGVRFQQLARWEVGEDIPSPDNVALLADYMDLPVATLNRMRAADITARASAKRGGIENSTAAALSASLDDVRAELTVMRERAEVEAQRVAMLTEETAHLRTALGDLRSMLTATMTMMANAGVERPTWGEDAPVEPAVRMVTGDPQGSARRSRASARPRRS